MDPHRLLGVGRNASKAEIKKAFKRLAQECHPDKLATAPEHLKQAAEARFRAVKEAYEVLTDVRRQAVHHSNHASANTSTGTSAQYQQWQYEEYLRHRTGARQNYAQTSAFLDWLRYSFRNFTRADAAFHAAIFTVTFGGFWALSGTGESLWRSANKGKSFEDVQRAVAAQQLRKQQKQQQELSVQEQEIAPPALVQRDIVQQNVAQRNIAQEKPIGQQDSAPQVTGHPQQRTLESTSSMPKSISMQHNSSAAPKAGTQGERNVV